MYQWIFTVAIACSGCMSIASVNADGIPTCTMETRTYETDGSSVAEGILDPDFDPNAPVILEFTRKVCAESVPTPPATDSPDSPAKGDIQVTTQQRGDWVYTYTRTYTGRDWFTTVLSKRYVGPLI
ncbi:hypothetical protein [Ferrimonas balearica]|uniref:hypothetical protein n=1 Tax=Ferrimonas balearica TaxID=44012 RepID=UPI001C98D915|nr:hypothetical protein [Ferrimonas balearica]MBY5979457.1 hypothetical protein [Ferrimonas balearica]